MFSAFKKEKPVALPDMLRLGSVVELSELNFALSEHQLLTPFPGTSHTVKAIGIIESGEYRVIRCYLDDPENLDRGFSLLELAVELENPNQIIHRRLFVCDGVLQPDSEEWFQEELPNWVNPSILEEEENYYEESTQPLIGAPTFEIDKNDYETLEAQYGEIDENQIDPDQIFVFYRVWNSEGSEAENFVDPLETQEKLYLDSLAEPFAEIRHFGMLYGRELEDTGGQNEYCFLNFFEGGPLETGIAIFTGVDLKDSDVKTF